MPEIGRVRVEPGVVESLSLENLLNLPDDQWMHFTQDVRANGELNPADVFNRNSIHRHLLLGGRR